MLPRRLLAISLDMKIYRGKLSNKYLDTMNLHANLSRRHATVQSGGLSHRRIDPVDRDAVDLFIEQWRGERADLNPAPLGVVSRVLMLAKHLEQSADHALRHFGLSLWQFDVLAALRRSGPPFVLSPSRLTQLVTLTSGAMTNRIDRLEELGLVRRESDPADRRGVLVVLTETGKRLADDAIPERLEDAGRAVAGLSEPEREMLGELLRKMILSTDRLRDASRINGRRRSSSN